MPSRGSWFAVAVASTTLSPVRTTAEPWACLANFPVSNVRDLLPASSTRAISGSGFIVPQSFSSGGHPYRGRGQRPGEGTTRAVRRGKTAVFLHDNPGTD